MSNTLLQFTEANNILSSESRQKVSVNCDFNSSIKCEQLYIREYASILQNMSRNDGRYICFLCSGLLKYSGRTNPNCTYNLDDTFLSVINTERKAYLLGWIASYGYIREGEIIVKTHKKDIELLKHFREVICPQIPIKENIENMVTLSISSVQMANDVCRHLNIEHDTTAQFPELQDEQLKWDFTRGYFECSGSLHITKSGSPQVIIYGTSNMLEYIKEFINIPCSIYSNHIKFNYINSIDFLGRLYKDSNLYSSRKYEKFVSSIDLKNTEFGMNPAPHKLPGFRYAKTRQEAIPPIKNRLSDSGYDLHLMSKIKEKDGVHYYDTCIRVQPDTGYYFDLVGRSSISKTGWTLANNIGIIDCSYSGSIIVALIKTRENADELILPCKLVQIIPRNLILMEAEEVLDLDETERHESGGLGSGQFKHS